jgi:hypothetical protein
MKVILEITSGPSQGRRIPLQAGELARFGRSDFADVCFPADPQMAEVHFELHCRHDGCRVRNLDAESGTLLNDQPIDEAVFSDGDQILAGQTCLLARVEGPVYSGSEESSPSNASSTDRETSPTAPITAETLCEPLDLEDASRRLLRPGLLPDAYIEALIDDGQFADAIRVLAVYLPKPVAIRWALDCLIAAGQGTLSPQQHACVDAVAAWLDDPGESQRRAAMQAAEASEYSGPASWIALAVFWSGGSIAPPELPEVLPEPQLCGQGVNAALLMLATHGDPTRTQERFSKIVQAGRQHIAQAGGERLV